jgi:hypothetical protein
MPKRYDEMSPMEKAMLPDTTRSEIERYTAMREAGLITPEEYEKMRDTILKATGLLG